MMNMWQIQRCRMVMHYFIPLNDLLILLNDEDVDDVVPRATGPSKPNVFPKNIDKLPTSNLPDESSIHGDDFHEMETVEDDIQDSGYESDTSLFKLSNVELERQVDFVADVQMSIIVDNRYYASDNNGKIHFL